MHSELTAPHLAATAQSQTALMETAERTNPQHKGQKTWGLSRVSNIPGWLEKFRRYLWDLYCDDPWKGFSGQWTQPSPPCLSRTGAVPRALAAPSPSAPSHGCTWTTDRDTRGERNNTSIVSSYTCSFLAPGVSFSAGTHFFFLRKDQLGCGCWFIPSFKFTKHQGRKGVWVHPTAKPGSAERAGAEGRSIICQHLFCTHPGVKTHLSGFGKRGHLEETVKHLKRLLSSSSSNFMLLFCFMIVFKACLYYLK